MKSVMKKLALASALLASGTAMALPYTETYSGNQSVSEGSSYNFGFDMWYDNDLNGVGTNSSLNLTRDAEGAFGVWTSAILTLGLSSSDFTTEQTRVRLTAWNATEQAGTAIDLGTVDWNGTVFNNSQSFTFNFTQQQLDMFDTWGWGNVNIGATAAFGLLSNDFSINSVSLLVNTADGAAVPEPASIALLGLGLVGLGFARRRTQKA